MSSQPGPSLDRVFQVLGDSTRLRIAALLASARQGACVCELTDALAERQYNISRHLKTLRAAGLVAPARDGRWVYYRLAGPDGPAGRRLKALLRTLTRSAELTHDRERFTRRLALRRHGRCCVWTAADRGVA
ncbi:MAG TPA: metalloregulator ArsR/SmtB family transcription factor [bacterium]|jgi:ArsR family transcriptional regulator